MVIEIEKMKKVSRKQANSFRKVVDGDIDIDEECLQLLRENTFVWAMDWAQRISIDIYKCNTRAPFITLSSFSRFVYQQFLF